MRGSTALLALGLAAQLGCVPIPWPHKEVANATIRGEFRAFRDVGWRPGDARPR